MAIDKKPFTSYTLQEDKDKNKDEVVPLKINKEWRFLIDEAKKLLEQKKDGTVIKQLMKQGYKSITSPENKHLIQSILGNRKKNQRSNIHDFD